MGVLMALKKCDIMLISDDTGKKKLDLDLSKCRPRVHGSGDDVGFYLLLLHSSQMAQQNVMHMTADGIHSPVCGHVTIAATTTTNKLDITLKISKKNLALMMEM